MRVVHNLCAKSRDEIDETTAVDTCDGSEKPVPNQTTTVQSTSQPGSIEILDVRMANIDMQKICYEQISMQITEMAKLTRSNAEQENEMQIELCTGFGSVKVVSSPPDGNCMLSSMAHQLFGYNMLSKRLKTEQKQMRAEVVQYIRENYDSFQHEIKGHVYDRRDEIIQRGEMTGKEKCDIDAECLLFLNHILPKNRVWCGSETLKAVSIVHNVNILVLNEEGPCVVAS